MPLKANMVRLQKLEEKRRQLQVHKRLLELQIREDRRLAHARYMPSARTANERRAYSQALHASRARSLARNAVVRRHTPRSKKYGGVGGMGLFKKPKVIKKKKHL